MDASTLDMWLGILDQLSYYELFRVHPRASQDELKHAFHAFASDFHPDGHVWRARDERAKIDAIFKRGTEAYRVLSDPNLRAQYDAALAQGNKRPAEIVAAASSGPSSGPVSIAPKSVRLIDQLRSPGSRAFVLKAQELEKKGDFRQAKLQLAIALNLEGNNAPLEEYAKKLDEKARQARK
jgi:DnaJ-class molecular chaperone